MTAHRVRSICGRVFRYAVATGRSNRDVAADLRGALVSTSKMDRAHVVPLSRQAVAILEELDGHTGAGHLLLPSLRSSARPISDNILDAALRRLGYSKDEQTAHGFRTIASTRLNELGLAPDVIEPQLAHRDRNKVRAAYNRAERLAERRTMMQTWADYLDGLKADQTAKVRPLGHRTIVNRLTG